MDEKKAHVTSSGTTLDSGAIWVSLGDPGTPLLNPPAPLGVPASAQYFPIENQNIMYIMNL